MLGCKAHDMILCANEGGAAGCSGATCMELQPPTCREEAEVWHLRLRLIQEALTLLRGLSVQPLLKDVVLDDHISSAASLRLCHATAGGPLSS